MVRDKIVPASKGASAKTVRIVLGILSILMLVVLTAAAGTPPNLANILKAQREMVAERPNDAEVYNDYGNLLALAGRSREAGDSYRRAIEIAPTATLARYNLGVLLRQSGQWKQALAEFQKLLEVDARHARSQYQLGMLFHSRNQRSKAVQHYAQAFAYDPELTFPNANPHVIENDLATEAILVSRRYSPAASSDTPRLYGGPERSARLMLTDAEKASAAAPAGKPVSEAAGNKAGKGKKAGAAFDAEDDVNDEDDEDDVGGEQRGRKASRKSEAPRALTSEDLDTGSGVGQVQRSSRSRSSAGRSTGRSTQGREGRSAVRPQSRRVFGVGREPDAGRGATGGADNSGRTNSGRTNSGRTQGPRSRPASRLSTGRLELELLPAGPGAARQRDAATATR